MNPVLFDSPLLDAPRSHLSGYRVESIKLEDGNRLRPEEIKDSSWERRAVFAGWRELYSSASAQGFRRVRASAIWGTAAMALTHSGGQLVQ